MASTLSDLKIDKVGQTTFLQIRNMLAIDYPFISDLTVTNGENSEHHSPE